MAGVDAQQFGVLVAFEMVTAMICYIPVAHLADKYGRRPFVLVTFLFFTLFPVTLLWAHSFGWLALAFVVRGLKEFGEPARKALIIGEAVPELRARTYGAYYLIRDCVVTSGSFLGAWLWSISPRANFIGAAICGALGTALVLVVYLSPEARCGIDSNARGRIIGPGSSHDNGQQDHHPAHPADPVLCGGGPLLRQGRAMRFIACWRSFLSPSPPSAMAWTATSRGTTTSAASLGRSSTRWRTSCCWFPASWC